MISISAPVDAALRSRAKRRGAVSQCALKASTSKTRKAPFQLQEAPTGPKDGDCGRNTALVETWPVRVHNRMVME